MSNITSAEQFENCTKDDYLRVQTIRINVGHNWDDDLNKMFKCINAKEISITFDCNMERPSSIPFDNFAIFQKLSSLQMSCITQMDEWWVDLDVPSVCCDGNNMLITGNDAYSYNALNNDAITNLNIIGGYNSLLLNNLPTELKKVRLCCENIENINIDNLPVNLKKITLETCKIQIGTMNKIQNNIKVPHGCKLKLKSYNFWKKI